MAAKKSEGPREIDFHSAEARKARATGVLPENTTIRSPYARKDAQGDVAHGQGVVLHDDNLELPATGDGPRRGED